MGDQPKCQCPHCGTKIGFGPEMAGTLATCPHCSGQFQLPQLTGAGLASAGQAFPTPSGRGLGLAFSDPMDSQGAAMQGLGRQNTLAWGFAFCLSLPIISWLAIWRGANLAGQLPGMNIVRLGRKDTRFFEHVEVIVTLSALVGVLYGVLLIVNAIRGNNASAGSILFSTGLIMVPITAFTLYGLGMSFIADKISSRDAAEVLGYITSFLMLLTMSSVFLLIFAALTSVIGYTRKAGFWLVPCVLMVTFVVFTFVAKLTGEIGNIGK